GHRQVVILPRMPSSRSGPACYEWPDIHAARARPRQPLAPAAGFGQLAIEQPPGTGYLKPRVPPPAVCRALWPAPVRKVELRRFDSPLSALHRPGCTCIAPIAGDRDRVRILPDRVPPGAGRSLRLAGRPPGTAERGNGLA